jgi:cobalt-zinc-cadmium resistance protein CzcA
MAKTYAYAIAGGLIATFTVAPVMSALLLPDKLSEVETFIVQRLRRVYEPASGFALANPVVTLGGALLLFGAAMFGVHSLGVEFLPHLEEGNLFIRAELPTSISLEAGSPPPMRSVAASRPIPKSSVSFQRKAAPTMAPTRPVSSTPNSLCRSSRRRNGPPAWTRTSSSPS